MKFICGINSAQASGPKPKRKCKQSFESLEKLLAHIKSDHNTTLGKRNA